MVLQVVMRISGSVKSPDQRAEFFPSAVLMCWETVEFNRELTNYREGRNREGESAESEQKAARAESEKSCGRGSGRRLEARYSYMSEIRRPKPEIT